MRLYWLYPGLLNSRSKVCASKGGIHLILCLALLRVFKTAISEGPVPPILDFTDQVWAGAVLGRKQESNRLAMKGGGFLEVAGDN